MRVSRLSGSIMCKDQKLCDFELNGYNVIVTNVEKPKDYVPFEFRKKCGPAEVYDFIQDRLPEDGRQNLLKDCMICGIQMTAEDIIHYSCGRVVDDPCWIRFSSGPQTYEECKADSVRKSDYYNSVYRRYYD